MYWRWCIVWHIFDIDWTIWHSFNFRAYFDLFIDQYKYDYLIYEQRYSLSFSFCIPKIRSLFMNSIVYNRYLMFYLESSKLKSAFEWLSFQSIFLMFSKVRSKSANENWKKIIKSDFICKRLLGKKCIELAKAKVEHVKRRSTFKLT